jgi:D-alanine-D-alanine ligase
MRSQFFRARNVLAALDRLRFEPVLIGIDKNGRWLAQDAQKLLSSAQDPRLVRIEAGLSVQMESPLAAPMLSSLATMTQIDVVFPVPQYDEVS